MDVKANYICGIYQKAFTKNSSLKRHRANVHLSTRYNCLTCPKTYKSREDMIKHSKKCLKNKLNEGCEENQPPLDHPSTSREVPQKAENKSKIIGNTVSRQTNTDISNISTCNKSTNTEPLIMISPDEILEFRRETVTLNL